MDLRQSKEYSEFLKKIGWKVEKRQGTYFFVKTLPLIGSAIKLQRTTTIPFQTLNILAKKYRVFQFIIEPEENAQIKNLLSNGFTLSKSPYLPTKTLRVKINQSEEKIIAQMKKDGRYSLRKSSNLPVRTATDIDAFRQDWKAVVRNKRHVLPLHELIAFKESFKDNMLLLENAEGTAGGMFLIAHKIAYYWIGFTSNTARNSLVQYQIIWNGMKWAKQRGATVFDFEGIYDERFPIQGWQGFTHFKKSFGGAEVIYPGSFIKWRLPL